MSEIELGGASAPAGSVATPPGANPVPAPDAPAGQENAEAAEPVKPPRTYSEDEHRKGISERLSKERKRIAREVKLELERDHYKAQAEGRTQQQQPRADADEIKEEPDPSKYDDPRKWARDFFKYEQQQAKKASQGTDERARAEQQQARAQEGRARRAQEKIVAPGRTKYPDFDRVVFEEDTPINEVMVEAACRLKSGADVIYHLAKNPEEAARIAALDDDFSIAWEMKALEQKLPVPKPTATPAPIVPSKPSGVTSDPYDGSDTKAHIKAYHARKR